MCILISAGKGSCSDDEYIIIITIIIATIIILCAYNSNQFHESHASKRYSTENVCMF